MTHIPETLLEKIRQGARLDEEQFVAGLMELADMVRAEYRWIPVTERMPADGMPVEILGDHRGAGGVGWFRDPFHIGQPYWNLCTIESGERVSHWRPIPESTPYNGENMPEDFEYRTPSTWPENR